MTIKKALNYHELEKNNFRFVDDNQLWSGIFTPLNPIYTERLAKLMVAQFVILRTLWTEHLLSPFSPIMGVVLNQETQKIESCLINNLEQAPELRLVLNDKEQIVGTFEITGVCELTDTIEATESTMNFVD